MDEFYSATAAAGALEESATINEEVMDRRLASLTKDTQWQTKYKVKQFTRPTTLRLIQYANDGVAEEAVFTIQGVLSGKDLPPISEKMLRSRSQARYLRQSISLVGYGTTTFDNAIKNAQEIYGMFDRNVQDASLESWTLSTSGTQGRVLEISNRYLTSKRDAPDMHPVPIPPSIDPRGVLEKLLKEGFLYGEENEVHYYQIHKTDTAGKIKRVETVNPQIFRIGDVVEAQVSFIAVPLKGDKHKMIIVLRSIALLDTSFSQDALRLRTQETKETQHMTLKRRVGYGDYIEEAENEEESSQMQVDKRQRTD